MYQDWTAEQRQKSETLIRRGSLRHLLNSTQKILYDFIKDPNNIEAAIYSARKQGKSFTLTVIGVERCLTEVGAVVKHAFPTLTLAVEVMEPLMEEVLNLFPEDMRPRQIKSKNAWVFKNGSVYKLIGVHPDNIKSGSARGPKCSMLLGDEVAFWHSQSYDMTLKSSLLPQQTLVKNPKRIYATTPPEQVDHPFITDTVPPIQRKGGFFRFTVYDNPMLTPERIEQLKEECGGEDSNAWRREYMAEIVAPVDRLVVPEFDRTKHVVTDEYLAGIDMAAHRWGYQAADLGVVDYTGILAAIYIPAENQIVVRKEDMYRGEGLGHFTEVWNAQRAFMRPYITQGDKTITGATIDCFEQARKSLIDDFGLDFKRPTKRKLVDNIGYLRMCVGDGRVLIHEDCKDLIIQLETGLWKEATKEDNRQFERNETHGHLDLIATLMYLVRMVPWGRSPGDSNNGSVRMWR